VSSMDGVSGLLSGTPPIQHDQYTCLHAREENNLKGFCLANGSRQGHNLALTVSNPEL